MRSGRMLAAALVCAFVGVGTAAQAAEYVYDWAFECNDGSFCDGAGTLRADGDVTLASPVKIIQVNGTFGDGSVTNLLGPNDPNMFNDNELLALTPDQALSDNGFAFTVSSTFFRGSVRIAANDVDYLIQLVGLGGLNQPVDLTTTGLFIVTKRFDSNPPSTVPLPATLALFGSGLSTLGVMVYRRRREGAA